MTRGDEIRQYLARMAEFNRWEEEHPTPERDPAAVLADLSLLYSLVPREERQSDPDPEKLGIQRMRAIIALMKSSG